MNKLIFGSTALKHWFPDLKRTPADLDWIGQEEKITEKEQTYWAPFFQYILENNLDDKYVDPNFLLTIKLSHFAWPRIHWLKTEADILFLFSKGVTPDVKLYRSLVKDWRKIHGKNNASLKGKTSESFFEDAVARKYVHDDIHLAVAENGVPVYTKILKDPNSGSVECSKEKFLALTADEKKLMVFEEVWVTALERFLIPSDFTYGSARAYAHSLKKMATTMSGGWMREWIHFNYPSLVNNKDKSYIKKFNTALTDGKIRSTNIS